MHAIDYVSAEKLKILLYILGNRCAWGLQWKLMDGPCSPLLLSA